MQTIGTFLKLTDETLNVKEFVPL